MNTITIRLPDPTQYNADDALAGAQARADCSARAVQYEAEMAQAG